MEAEVRAVEVALKAFPSIRPHPVLLADWVWSPGCRSYSVFYTYSFDGNPVAGRLHKPKPSDCAFIVPGTLEEAPEHEHEYWPQALARLREKR